jgi:undecaprenyl-diphosphatase
MSLGKVILLAVVQGLAELLPVSSSAHVIVAEKIMDMDPAAPEMTLLLVMLHTGTMFAVIAYFWRRWRQAFFQSVPEFKRFAVALIWATALTIFIGGGLIETIERFLLRRAAHAWVEQLWDRLDLIAPALAAVGILILIAGLFERRPHSEAAAPSEIPTKRAFWIGVAQGLCLPFRGFSRSGATISTGMLFGVPKVRSEDFSFALAVVITPLAIAREAWRLIQAQRGHLGHVLASSVMPSILGAAFAFLAGLLALKWLSRWLEEGRWYWFGIYCLIAATAVAVLHFHFGY